MIDILHRDTSTVLYHSETAQTVKEAVEEAVSRSIYLRGAFLDGAFLRGASLRGAFLDDASLRGASLDGASLDGAFLDGASLDDASLDGASLRGAFLDGASLRGASLDGASLDGAFLRGASLRGAFLDGAKDYVDSHDIFAAVMRRQPITAFTSAEWAAVGQLLIHRLCWGQIRRQYADVAPRILTVLAEAGFREWLERWEQGESHD